MPLKLILPFINYGQIITNKFIQGFKVICGPNNHQQTKYIQDFFLKIKLDTIFIIDFRIPVSSSSSNSSTITFAASCISSHFYTEIVNLSL